MYILGVDGLFGGAFYLTDYSTLNMEAGHSSETSIRLHSSKHAFLTIEDCVFRGVRAEELYEGTVRRHGGVYNSS
jgi:hypothetical protein